MPLLTTVRIKIVDIPNNDESFGLGNLVAFLVFQPSIEELSISCSNELGNGQSLGCMLHRLLSRDVDSSCGVSTTGLTDNQQITGDESVEARSLTPEHFLPNLKELCVGPVKFNQEAFFSETAALLRRGLEDPNLSVILRIALPVDNPSKVDDLQPFVEHTLNDLGDMFPHKLILSSGERRQ